MKAEHYFLEIQRCIHNIASKADLFMFKGAIKKEDWEELFEDALILHIFHMSCFKIASPILMNFIEKKDLKKKLTKEERSQLGAFFTPPYIAQYICKNTISPLIDKIENDKKVKDKVKKISELKICDPAVGGGIFLVCAQDCIIERMLQVDQEMYNIVDMAKMSLKTIYGVDINPAAIEFSKLALNLNTAKWKLLKKFDQYAIIAEKNSL